MSYTSFSYSDLKADETSVAFTITNTGKVDGAEIAQVYVSCKDGKVFRSKKELKGFAKGKPDLNILFIYNMPFRAMGKMSGGMVSDRMVDDIVFLVNGHFWRGLGRLIADFFRNQSANKAFLAKLK